MSYKFVAKMEITPPDGGATRKEEHVFGISKANLKGAGFTDGFARIMLNKLENEKWISNFIKTSHDLQNRLSTYHDRKYKVKYDQVVEEVV